MHIVKVSKKVFSFILVYSIPSCSSVHILMELGCYKWLPRALVLLPKIISYRSYIPTLETYWLIQKKMRPYFSESFWQMAFTRLCLRSRAINRNDKAVNYSFCSWKASKRSNASKGLFLLKSYKKGLPGAKTWAKKYTATKGVITSFCFMSAEAQNENVNTPAGVTVFPSKKFLFFILSKQITDKASEIQTQLHWICFGLSSCNWLNTFSARILSQLFTAVVIFWL